MLCVFFQLVWIHAALDYSSEDSAAMWTGKATSNTHCAISAPRQTSSGGTNSTLQRLHGPPFSISSPMELYTQVGGAFVDFWVAADDVSVPVNKTICKGLGRIVSDTKCGL